MKTTVTQRVTQEIEIAAIRMELAVLYDEEDIPNDYPHRKGDLWKITVDMDSGQIRDWPEGIEPREIYMKVCDSGSYYLLAVDGSEVASIEDDYVPNRCVPGEYGDYVGFQIDAAGRITNWKKKPDVSQFFDDE